MITLTTFNLLFALGVPKFHIIETDFREYFDEFMNETLTVCNIDQLNASERIVIGFDKTVSKDAVGECYRWPNSIVIKIDEKYWNMIDNDERRTLLLHEAAHCFLNQDHIEEQGHFMYPNSQSIKKDILIKQLHEIARSKCESK